MELFDGFIARSNCVVSPDTIRANPRVRALTQLPGEWMFWEFHHPLFRVPDFLVPGIWNKRMSEDPSLRQQRIEMLAEERALLAPWYSKKKKIGDADALAHSGVCIYRISTLNAMKWVKWEEKSDWGELQRFAVHCVFAAGQTDDSAFSRLISSWAESSSGGLKLDDGIRRSAGHASFSATCAEPAGNWIASLWVLLSDPRFKAGVKEMSIEAL